MGVRGKQFVPTGDQRRAVESATGLGTSQVTVAKLLGISLGTLEKHFRRELDTGGELACQKIAATLFQRAIDLKGGMPSVTAAIFFLKARGKGNWRDDFQTIEHVGAAHPHVVVMLPDNGRDPHLVGGSGKRPKVIEGRVAPKALPMLEDV